MILNINFIKISKLKKSKTGGKEDKGFGLARVKYQILGVVLRFWVWKDLFFPQILSKFLNLFTLVVRV
jgi:hypothetical protein